MPSLQTPYAPLKEASNSALTNNINMSLELSPPIVIPYSANVLADPSFWNSNFIATLLFSTNKFVTNFIWSYLYQLFDDSHGLKASLKPLRGPFNQYQSHLEAINNGQDIKQINW